MRTIIFGINDDATLSPGFSGIDLTNIMGEYLDVLQINGDNYLITKVLKSRNESNNHKIDVREIAQDTFSDGQIENYSSIEKSDMCLRLEQLLNSGECKEDLRSGLSVCEILDKNGISSFKANLFSLFTKYGHQANTGDVTSVAPHLFESLKNMSKSHLSSFEMYSQMIELQNKIDSTASTKSL